MRTVDLREGLVVVARGAAATVVRCLPDLKLEIFSQSLRRVITVNMDEIEILPVRDDKNFSLVSNEVFSRAVDSTPEEFELAKERFETIALCLSGAIDPRMAAEKLKIRLSYFYKLKKLYDINSGPSSLIRLARGRPQGARLLSYEVENYIKLAIDKKYQGKAATYAAVWREVECLCIENDHPIPSRNAVVARIKSLDKRELHERKYGAESASQRYDRKPGKKNTSRPLQHTQMDHTLVDVILVDDEKRCPVGRPWLTVVIDIHTRVILGYYLSLHAPSSVSVASAVSFAALPKHSFLKSMNLPPGLYPYYGVPAVIHMDNAKEFKSTKFQMACARNGIEPQWRPLGRKHYGGHVERLIGTLMTDNVHFLPGSTFSNVLKRRDYDSEKNAALTFKEFSRWFAGQVAVYHGRTHKSLGISPKLAWENFFKNSKGEIRYPSLVPRALDFKLDFMPEERRRIHPNGIMFGNRWYWSPALQPYIGQRQVIVKYDPYSMRSMWARIENEYIQLNFSDVTSDDFTFEEYRASLYRGGIKRGKAQSLEDPLLVSIIRGNERLVENSIKETKRARRQKQAIKESQESSSNLDIKNIDPQNAVVGTAKPDYSQKAAPYCGGKK